MTGPEYLSLLRAGGARGLDSGNALRLIARVRSGRLRNNPDVAALCRALAQAMNLGDIDAAPKPPTELRRQNIKEYYRRYMRWHRQN
jgi:hypothetical protein